jgi:hypothetical protein
VSKQVSESVSIWCVDYGVIALGISSSIDCSHSSCPGEEEVVRPAR